MEGDMKTAQFPLQFDSALCSKQHINELNSSKLNENPVIGNHKIYPKHQNQTNHQ